MLSLVSGACGKQGIQPSISPPVLPAPTEEKSEKVSKPEVYQVDIINFSFSPQTLEIPVGATVTWVNQDRRFHTVTCDDGSFESKKLAKGGTFSYSFEKKGTYEYHCTSHSYMKGKIIVNGEK
jgi:plastocyanin